MNQLKNLRGADKRNSLSIFTDRAKFVDPFENLHNETKREQDNNISIDHLMQDADTEIKLATAERNAIELVNSSIEIMKLKLDEVKPEKLPAFASAAGKIVTDIRRERSESAKNRSNQNVHFHFYTPEQKKLQDYEVIDVNSVGSNIDSNVNEKRRSA